MKAWIVATCLACVAGAWVWGQDVPVPTTAESIRALLGEIEADEPATAHEAMEAIVRLGVAALPALREARGKTQLQETVRQVAEGFLQAEVDRAAGRTIQGVQPGRIPEPRQPAEVVADMKKLGTTAAPIDQKVTTWMRRVKLYPYAPEVQAAAAELLAGLGKTGLPAMEAARQSAEGASRGLLSEAIFAARVGMRPDEVLVKWMQEHCGDLPAGMPRAEVADAEGIQCLFPERLFYRLVIRQHPVARPAPKGLGHQNVFVVDAKGTVTHLGDAGALERYFQANLPNIDNLKVDASWKQPGDSPAGPAARMVLAAWLELSPTYSQDGMYRWAFDPVRFKIEERHLDGAGPKPGAFTR